MMPDTRIITPEQEFIKELNNYLEYPLSKHGESKVKLMLLTYRTKNPLLKIVKQADAKIVADALNRKRSPRKVIQPEDIIRIVSEYVGIESDNFLNVKCRSEDLVYAKGEYTETNKGKYGNMLVILNQPQKIL